MTASIRNRARTVLILGFSEGENPMTYNASAELFTPASRGLNISLSKILLLKGFSTEIFKTIKDNSIKKILEDKFDIWLKNNQSE